MLNFKKKTIKNVCLIGLMGSGKSMIGRDLSKVLNLDFYDTQMAFKGKMRDIKQFQENKINDVSGNVASNAGDSAVNQRLASFYTKQTGLIERTIPYLRIIYWTLFAIQVIAAIMLFRKSNKNRLFIILGMVLLAIFPLYNTLYPILEKIFHIFKLFPSP